MSDLKELYQNVILDHNRHPRNFGDLPDANRTARGHNPLCGDEVTIHAQVEGGVIQDVRFGGSGCAISVASASVMTEVLKGKSRAEAERLVDDFQQMVTGHLDPKSLDALGKLRVFEGVKAFPMRVKCATLPWHTLRSALESAKTARNNVEPLRQRVIEALKTIYDPEIPISIYELGLIYDIDISPQNDVRIQMTLTSPGCPEAESLPTEVELQVSALDGVSSCRADIVWEPVWTPDRLSQAAKLELNLL
jgi:nitrogen fixation NifU-like protein